jgi:hypothetical protein
MTMNAARTPYNDSRRLRRSPGVPLAFTPGSTFPQRSIHLKRVLKVAVENLLAPVYELFSQMCENPAPVARLSGGGLYTLTQASRKRSRLNKR